MSSSRCHQRAFLSQQVWIWVGFVLVLVGSPQPGGHHEPAWRVAGQRDRIQRMAFVNQKWCQGHLKATLHTNPSCKHFFHISTLWRSAPKCSEPSHQDHSFGPSFVCVGSSRRHCKAPCLQGSRDTQHLSLLPLAPCNHPQCPVCRFSIFCFVFRNKLEKAPHSFLERPKLAMRAQAAAPATVLKLI